MSDKSNILAGLAMATTNQQQSNKENNQQQRFANATTRSTTSGATAPIANRQHKLKQRFTVIRKLGKGTYGKVQLAINKETGQEVAIKTIKKTKIENEQDLQRVRREIQIMSSIEHPHIIHIYEVFENKDKIVLVMQYAPGGELYEYVSQSKVLDDSEARRIFRQIATAIYYCHQNKICHRDLKLENILLDEKNNAKLADFGLSNVFDKRRQLQTFCGSPLYASPEIVQGSPYEGPEVDCWSLGVLLYTLVYGAMPFDGSNFKRLVKQISEACYFEPKQRSQASPLIRRLLCADPLKRANVLDICADPWVNGQSINLAPGSPRNNELQQPAQVYPSLVQVAQDMANLTPVRLDLLLALAPTSPVIPQQKAALGELSDNSTAHRHSPTLHLEPALMELGETRASSPVASYIVRDLDSEQQAEAELDDNQEQQLFNDDIQQTEEMDHTEGAKEQKPDRAESVELSVAADPQQVRVISEQVLEQPAQQVEHSMSIEADDLSANQPQPEADIEAAQTELPFVESVVAMDVEDAPEAESQLSEVDQKVASGSAPDTGEVVKEESSDVKAEVEGANMEEKLITPAEESGEAAAVDVPTESAEQAEAEKPAKKVKKKIIVVKKRKKVTKKEAGSEQVEQQQQETKDKSRTDKVEESNTTTTAPAADEKPKTISSTKVKGPGKVRIPNTFQATPDEGIIQPAPVKPPEGRRQSTLVADVSQKLLQQLQQQNAEQAPPVQLPGARVSDKKSEFERRASLAVSATVSSSGSPLIGSVAEEEAAIQLAEPMATEALRESLSILDDILQTLVEPVQKQEPQEMSLLKPPENLSDNDPLTPTGESPTKFQSDSTKLANDYQRQIERKLDEYTATDRRKESEESSRSTATAGEERSDSVETIKADEFAVEEPAKVRSSLVVDLTPRLAATKKEQQQPIPEQRQSRDSVSSLSPQQQMNVVGPAPITRSYKKVTFTRDGACITETGKIYATQRDDGSVRRVERKSKVTHYPATGHSSGQQSANQLQSSRVHEEQQEETEEEVIYESGGLDHQQQARSSTAAASQRLWKESQSSLFSSNSRQVSGRPFEKLIMPSTGLLNERDDDFRRHSLFSRQSGPLGRADSGSSCSSSSTDVFDDIFDTWTGAISMFNKKLTSNSRAGGPASSLLSKAFEELAKDEQSLLFSRKTVNQRRRGMTSSLAGTPRCESVEPTGTQHQRSHKNNQNRQYQRPDSSASGYESDTRERPASAVGVAGGGHSLFHRERLFGRPNLSDAMEPSLFGCIDRDPLAASGFGSAFGRGNQLLRDIEQEHESLRQRLAREHRQLWKGSTPSLFRDDEAEEAWQRDSRYSTQREQPESAAQRPRAFTTTTAVATAAEPTDAEQVLNQSQSSSSFLRHSVALDASPQRVNLQSQKSNFNESLPPQPVRKSISKTSLITRKVANIQLTSNTSSSEKQQPKTCSSASFIELKRTSSSSSNHQPFDHQHLQQQQQQLVSSAAVSNSSSAFWEGRITPISSATSDALANQKGDFSPSTRDQTEARVQNWLQESTGNVSSLSGSHSSASASASDSLNAGSRADPFTNLYGSRQHSTSLLPPIGGPIRSSSRTLQTSDSLQSAAGKQQVKSVTVSAIRRSAATSEDGEAKVEEEQQRERQHVIQREETDCGEQVKSISSSNKVTSTSFSLRLNSPNEQQQQQVKQQVVQKVSSSSTQSATILSKNTEGLHWPRTANADSLVFAEENEDSISAPGSAELDSTSSLLDQLRSRGYRSMINQRMVAQPLIEEQQQQVSSTRAVKTECSRVVSSSTSSTVSGGNARVVQQKQVFTTLESTSSQSNLDQQELPPECSSTTASAVTPLTSSQVEKPSNIDNNVDDDKKVTAEENTNTEPDLRQLKDEHQQQQQEEEDMDEDVREAKANIKGYLDSVKETEIFLKSLQQEEEQLERQRQQLYLFNNLVLSSKLNGINRSSYSNNNDISNNNNNSQTANSLFEDFNLASTSPVTHNNGALSAPVRSSNFKLSEPSTNGFIQPSVALSFEPTYTIPTNSSPFSQYTSRLRPFDPLQLDNDFDDLTTNSGSANVQSHSYLNWRNSGINSASLTRTTMQNYHVDPLEPVEAISLQQHAPLGSRCSFSSATPDRSITGRYGRSQSQLNDQFTDYRRRRPLSANLDSLGDSNPYFPSRAKRASSQMRYPTRSNRYTGAGEGPAMSEYRSAYSGLQAATTNELAPRLPSPSAVSPSRELSEGSDDEMSAYRATNYVPRVIPMIERGRTPVRRSLSKQPTSDWQDGGSANKSSSYTRERRTSLQSPVITNTTTNTNSNLLDISREVSPIPVTTRRSSLDELNATSKLENGGNSRLCQLEQRIEQNRKRREQLLSGRLSPQPQQDESRSDAQPAQKSGDLSSAQRRTSSSTSSGIKFNRPSRLESMEARIKRRSYCVRLADCSPERTHLRGQTSLEKWRPGGTTTSASSSKQTDPTTPVSDCLFQIPTTKQQAKSAGDVTEACGSTTNVLEEANC